MLMKPCTAIIFNSNLSVLKKTTQRVTERAVNYTLDMDFSAFDHHT